MKSCQKMKIVFFTDFRQKRKTLYKRNVSGTLFRPESQKREFSNFGSKNVEMSSFFASGELLAPQTLQNGKVGQKVKKAVLGVLGSKNVPRTLRFHCFALGAKIMIFRLSPIFAFFRFLGAKSVFGLQKWSKTLKPLKIRHFAPFCENGLQNT